MSKLIYLKGLPGSGKTTLAREKYPEYYRVNKDDIRAMLYGDAKWSKEREQNVLVAQSQIVKGLLTNGKNVVVDNTGFAESHISAYKMLCDDFKTEFIVEDLSSVPLHECLERNAQRTGKARVPDKVIHDMWERYVKPGLVYLQDPTLPPCIIVDVDGTVATGVRSSILYSSPDSPGRGPFEWDRVKEDSPRTEVITAIHGFRTAHYQRTKMDLDTFFFSGRDSVCYGDTLDWLSTHVFQDDLMYLFMRAAGDNRKDYIVKRELWEKHIKDKYNVVAVFDDRPSVLRLWRELGFTTFDVGPGVEF